MQVLPLVGTCPGCRQAAGRVVSYSSTRQCPATLHTRHALVCGVCVCVMRMFEYMCPAAFCTRHALVFNMSPRMAAVDTDAGAGSKYLLAVARVAEVGSSPAEPRCHTATELALVLDCIIPVFRTRCRPHGRAPSAHKLAAIKKNRHALDVLSQRHSKH
jgi:hypothetical protein